MPEKLVGWTLRKRLTEESFKGKVQAKTGDNNMELLHYPVMLQPRVEKN